jgi:GTP cyclohydrolase IA
VNRERVAELVRELLVEIGEDPEREGLRETPRRVTEAWEFFSRGYRTTPQAVVKGAIFRQETTTW